MTEKYTVAIEKINQKYRQFIIFILSGIVLAVAGFVIGIFLSMIGFVGILIGVALIGVGSSYRGQCTTIFKNTVLPEYIKEYCSPNVYYDKHSCIPWEEVALSGLFPCPDRYRGQDLLIDSYDGVKYHISDICLEEKRVVRRNNHTTVEYIPYYQGQFLVFDYPSDLEGEVYLVKGKPYMLHQTKKIDVESIELNKNFNIYATDEVYAFEILTPHMISKIVELMHNYGKGIQLAFTKDKLYVALPGHNFLDIKFSSKLSQKNFDQIKFQLLTPPAIINEFKLDRGKFQE